MNKQQEPRLRFKGFTGAWEYKKFENVLSIKSGMSQKEIEVSDGIYPILATGGEIGRTNTALYDKESVLIGRKGTIDKPYYMNTPFWTVDTLFYSELKNNIDGKFLYFLFQCIEWRKLDTSTGVPSLTSTTIHEIQRYFPSKPEQIHLGLFFRRLDSQIAESRAVLEKSRQLKKAMLAKMFPANGEKIPKIRFKGFEGAWEREILKDVVNVFDNLRIPVSENKRTSGNTPYFGANGIQDYVDGFTHNGEFVLIAEDGANDLKNYPVQYVNGKCWVNNHAHVLQGKSEILNNIFLFSRFQSMDISQFLVGGGRAKLNGSTMLEIEIEFPKDKKEQTAIGNFFRQLDETIALQSAEVEKLNQLKKGLLAAMLV